jgi:hypothetical protein
MKAYYAQASAGGADFDYEVQAMFPSLQSIQAIGVGGVIKTTANTLSVKSSVNFNLKKGTGVTPTSTKSIQCMSEC